jgi:Na+/melibiose symporter-like transporter
VAIVFGIIRAGDHADWSRADVVVPLLAGAVLLAAFVLVELRSDHPTFDVRLFANRPFSAASASVAMVFFALMGLAFVLSYYLQVVRDQTPLRAGAMLLPAAVGIAAGSAGAPSLARRIGVRTVVPSGMALAAAGFAASLGVGRTTSAWYYESCILVVAFGVGVALAPSTEVVMAQLPRDRPGGGAAMNSTMRLVGASLGVAVLGALLSGAYRSHLGDLSALPAGSRDEAAGSIGATATVVQQVADAARRAVAAGTLPMPQALRLRADLTALVNRADDAFVTAMHQSVICGALVCLLGAVVAAVWLPRRQPASDPATDPASDPATDSASDPAATAASR